MQARQTWIWIIISIAALALRAILLLYAPKFPYPFDHGEFGRWGLQATDEGVLTVYDKPPQAYGLRTWTGNGWSIDKPALPRMCNYPPLPVYLFYGSARLLRAATDDTSLNTVLARITFSIWSLIGEIVLAAGCAVLVRQLCPRSTGLWAFALVLFLPPLWWDTVFWAQTEALVLAPLLWMLVLMLRQRWIAAGVLYGLAAALKPQAILFGPIWLLALVTVRPIRGSIAGMLCAAVTFLLPAIPFVLHGGWKWFESSYVANLTSTYAQRTTLWAFNLWYFDILLNDSDDAMARWMGLTKNTWGQIALLLALALGFVWAFRRWRHDRRGLVPWAALSVLLFVIIPTQVHERYLLLAVILLLVACAMTRWLWPAVVLLSIVAVAQMTWPIWKVETPGATGKLNAALNLAMPAGQTASAKRSRELERLQAMTALSQKEYWRKRWKTLPWEWTFTIAAMLGFVWSIAALTTATTAPAASNRPGSDLPPPASEPP